MSVHVRVRGGWLRCLVCVVAVALVGPGCRRAVRPEAGEDRTVEAGVPVRFGAEGPEAPVVSWRFGDEGEPKRGAQVTHAFHRPGTYTVSALEEGEVLDTARVTVVPRPVLRAIPADAEVAVYFPEIRGNVEPVLAFYSRLLGAQQGREVLEGTPLLGLVARELEGGARVVDVEEGLGFFSLPGFPGTVGLLGVTEPEAALEAVAKELEAGGLAVARGEPQGLLTVRSPEGGTLLLFVDRGYLYLVMPDGEAEREGGVEPLAEEEEAAGLASVRARVVGMSGPGLSESPLLEELRGKVAAGNVHFFARPVGEDEALGLRGLWGVLRAEPDRAELEGWVATERPLFGGRSAPVSELLEKAPAGPIAALMVSVPPEELAKLVFGAPDTERRERTLERLEAQGFEAAGADELLGALKGDLALLVYFDAAAFYRNFVRGSRSPEPRGALLFEAGLSRAEPVVEWLTRRLEARGQPFEVLKGPASTRLRTRLMEQPVQFVVTPERLRMHAGEALDDRPAGDVGEALRERFGDQAFAEGHVSAMVDLGRLRAELEAPREVPGVPPQQLPVARSLVATLLEQLPPIQLVFLDFAPEEGGGRFRARTLLREP